MTIKGLAIAAVMTAMLSTSPASAAPLSGQKLHSPTVGSESHLPSMLVATWLSRLSLGRIRL